MSHAYNLRRANRRRFGENDEPRRTSDPLTSFALTRPYVRGVKNVPIRAAKREKRGYHE